jgi:16S rRNA (adenine1518-N6/adenine1519-N6)-dimethyltransferase
VTHGRADIHELLAANDLHPSRALGQNFVADGNTVRKIAHLAGVGPGSRVVEIGAGLGSLTLALVETGAEVIAVEIDRRVVRVLRAQVEPLGVQVVEADALTVDWGELLKDGAGADDDAAGADDDAAGADDDAAGADDDAAGADDDAAGADDDAAGADDDAAGADADAEGSTSEPTWSLVANLPYNVAIPLVIRVLEEAPQVSSLLVMVQREVGERLAAQAGDEAYGAVSVKVAYWARASVVGRVPASVFIPRPKVESVLVRLDRRPRPEGEVGKVSYERLFSVVRAGFAHRRKMLRRSLDGLVDPRAYPAADVEPTARAEELGLDEWRRLSAWEPTEPIAS